MDEVRLASADVVAVSSRQVIPDGAIAWQRDRVVAVGPRDALCSKYPRAEETLHTGCAIFPSLINLPSMAAVSSCAGMPVCAAGRAGR